MFYIAKHRAFKFPWLGLTQVEEFGVDRAYCRSPAELKGEVAAYSQGGFPEHRAARF